MQQKLKKKKEIGKTNKKKRNKSECLGVVISSKKTIVHKFNYTNMSLVKSKLFPGTAKLEVAFLHKRTLCKTIRQKT